MFFKFNIAKILNKKSLNIPLPNFWRINYDKAKPYIMPMPVLILSSYDDKNKPCAMLAV